MRGFPPLRKVFVTQRKRGKEIRSMVGLNFVRWLRLMLVVGLGCLLLLGGCSFNSGSSTAGGKTLTIAVEGTYPPFEFQSDQGELQGFDVDLMNAIASKFYQQQKNPN